MQEDKDHFILQDTSVIQGACTEFISEEEKLWRSIDKYEQYPFKRVASHTRNILYVPSNTRTLDTLKKVLAYLIDKLFPIFFDLETKSEQKERVALFLEERLIAIRCEYFVQGIVCPRQILRLLRCFMVVSMMKGISSGISPLIGLELLIQKQSKEIMETSFPTQYFQALKYSIISSQKKELTKLLHNHPIILQEENLYKLLKLKLKIESNNYFAYYQALEEESPLVRCLLWLKMEEVKETFGRIIKKSFGDVPQEWLYKRLCLNNVEEKGWINLKTNSEVLQKQEMNHKVWFDLQTIKVVVS